MAKFFLGQKVRIVGLDTTYGPYQGSRKLGHWIGNTGTIGGLYPDGVSVLTDNAEEPSDSLGDGWFFCLHCVEPILPSGHTASTESFQELMDRLNTEKVERVEEVGA